MVSYASSHKRIRRIPSWRTRPLMPLIDKLDYPSPVTYWLLWFCALVVTLCCAAGVDAIGDWMYGGGLTRLLGTMGV